MITDLESAIKHCEEVAEYKEAVCKTMENEEGEFTDSGNTYYKYCKRRASEHRQLAEWLRELVHLRNITEYLRDMVTCFEFMDSMHYNEDIIEWAESELRVDMREVNADDNIQS